MRGLRKISKKNKSVFCSVFKKIALIFASQKEEEDSLSVQKKKKTSLDPLSVQKKKKKDLADGSRKRTEEEKKKKKKISSMDPLSVQKKKRLFSLRFFKRLIFASQRRRR